MNKPSVYFNDYVSLAVMLLMIVALVAGQADAQSTAARESAGQVPLLIQDEWPVDGLEQGFDDRLDIALDGRIGDHAIELSLTVVTDSEHFRGEDE